MNTAGLIVLAAAAAAAIGAGLLWWRARARMLRLQRQLEDAARRADEAGRAADAFFDLVSHELRSPIAAIIGYQELLRDGAYGQVTQGAAEPLDRIGHSASHLLLLLDGIVDLARDRAGQLHPDIAPIDLADLLRTAAHDLRTYAEERSLLFSIHIDDGLPTIMSDRERIARALNLTVVSAVRHAAGDRVQLSARRQSDGVLVRIAGLQLPLRPGAQDPTTAAGIRVAIAAATVRRLGGDLRIEAGSGGAATEISLHIRDAGSL